MNFILTVQYSVVSPETKYIQTTKTDLAGCSNIYLYIYIYIHTHTYIGNNQRKSDYQPEIKDTLERLERG